MPVSVSLNGYLLSDNFNTNPLKHIVPSWDFSLFFHETILNEREHVCKDRDDLAIQVLPLQEHIRIW